MWVPSVGAREGAISTSMWRSSIGDGARRHLNM